MEQKFDTVPHAEIRLEGRKVIRGDVRNDWGLRLQWSVSRDGKVIATPAARAAASYEHSEATPGKYEIVLQMWKYINYNKNAAGEFTASQFINVSNVLTFTV